MTKTTPQPEEATSRKPVTPIDMTKPIWVTFRQTLTRNVYDVFGSSAEAMAAAAEDAKSLNTTVAVFGPQIAAYAPPAPPVAVQVALDFGPQMDAADGEASQ
jgi:hypothetical protein